ncbi:MAG: HAMP domain-containing methyl-accepting chemotaxis protein [Phenylobacterium sp.]
MKISSAVNLFAGAIIAALLVAAATSVYTLEQLRVGGPVYTRIVQGKDLIADILPPPLYVIEAYLETRLAIDNPAAAQATKARLKKLHADYDDREAYWLASNLDGGLRTELTQGSHAEAQRFWQETETVFVPALEKGDTAAARLSLGRIAAAYTAHRAIVDDIVTKSNAMNAATEATAAKTRTLLTAIMAGVATLATLLLLAGVVAISRGVVRPIGRMTAFMTQLATGEYSLTVPFRSRRDEIGEMAEAVEVFRSSGVEQGSLRQQQEDSRLAEAKAEAGRQAEKEAASAELASVMETLAGGLSRLSAGDLSQRLADAFPAEFEQTRTDFNSAVDSLSEAMAAITTSSGGIRGGASEIGQASDDLSRRTEQQAASLEQTAAALDAITDNVRKTAVGANHAREVVTTAKQDAELSAQVVRDAVAAMSEIEQSSAQVGQIIGVIDEIAFQTNLLALNAGVEAARAGDAGKGFAVVASEVRALAQRSADAAKEIKTLISDSSRQVEAGVKLVGETGVALERIQAQVLDIDTVVSEIAASAAEQATGLAEVNIAITQMDTTTQQNAAMVEQATAAAHSLTQETDELVRLVGRFEVNSAPTAQAA